MIGGRVIETVTLEDKIWLNVRDRTYPKDTCALYLARNADSEAIMVGDSIWWQGGFAFWTPASREVADRRIPRASYSGVDRPAEHDVLDQEALCED